MRAQIFGALRFQSGSAAPSLPSGQLAVLLRRLLLRPNETHGHDSLAELLWPPQVDPDRELARDRLYVVVSRLRRFLHDDDPAGLRLVTDTDGYRLEAGAAALDRTAFESLADRALAGEPELVAEVLAYWRGEPYEGFPSSETVHAERARLHELRDALERLSGDLQAPGRLRASHARTKFLRPTTPSGAMVVRQHLLDRMGEAGQHAVVAVVAPAGFGKSVLLSQWAESQVGLVGWLGLEESDNDPQRCWSAIGQSLAEAGVVEEVQLPSDAAPGSGRFIEALAATVATAPAPVGLVLDDFHQVGNATLHEQVGGFIERLTGQVTLAIGSRLPVPRALQDHLDGAGVRRIGGGDLRFRSDEVAGIVQSSRQQFDSDQMLALTEGWPIAVAYLTRLGVRLPASEVATSALEGYVIDEVQQTLPQEIRDFLLETAHLHRFSAGLCDAVRDRSDAQRHLDWLRDRQLFLIEVATDTGWYRYHHLVGGVLRRLAENSPDVDVAAGHRRAARWYGDQGLLEQALEHAVAGGDGERVADYTGDVLWSSVSRNEIYTCRRWLHRIDPDMVAVNRGAHDLATLAAAGWLEPDRCAEWMDSRRRHFGDDDLLAWIAEAHTAYLQGRARDCVAINERALALVDGYFDEHPSRAGVREATTGTLLASRLSGRILGADLHHDDGELAGMAELARTEMPVMALWVMGEWAFLAYVEGNRELAASLVAEVAPHLASMDEMSTHLSAGRLLVAQALVESERAMDRQTQHRIIRRLTPMIDLYRQLHWDVELVPVLLALHAVNRRAGDLAAATIRIDEADVLLGLCPDAPLLVRARSALTVGGADGGARSAGSTGVELTEREHAVLAHLETGLTYDAIAERLAVSRHTVADHVKGIYRKLGVRTRHGAVRRFRAQEGDGG